MPLFNWSDKFSVHVDEMDQQHKVLVNLINYFYEARQLNRDQEVLGKVLEELVKYAEMHFDSEEKLMKAFHYPEYTAHQAEHHSLLQKVLNMRERLRNGDKYILTDVAILMNDWLTEHLLTQDKKYGAFIESLEVKHEP